jgi:hypothetical protein
MEIDDTILNGPTPADDIEVKHSIPSMTMPESLLVNSRMTPTGNGNINGNNNCTPPTSGHKWWASVILGLIFALISCPPAYQITSAVTNNVAGVNTMMGSGPTLLGLIIHTIIFILIIRLILW